MNRLNLTILVLASIGLITITGCANKTQTGAAVGAGSGALIGHAVGGNSGAWAGAAIGGIGGALIGNNEDEKDRARATGY
ncbi:glycine zipper domain-containing protein [Sulfurovum sp.]|uniref:glycine zipper domain-containing protein n=1 Tax=Sulfurovum sp. TaxID=1969726 RepID=UPI002867DB5D|nr:glycine zipper domain-containing protein [Sulfurovum sp.]